LNYLMKVVGVAGFEPATR